MGTGPTMHSLPEQRRLALRGPHVLAQLRAAVGRSRPRGAPDPGRHGRLLDQASRAFATAVEALADVPADPTGPVRAAGAEEEASARALRVMLREVIAAVDRHPDRQRLVVDAAVAMHRVLAQPQPAPPAPPGPRTVDTPCSRQVARDVHDWVGNGVSLALRQLELHALETHRSGSLGRGTLPDRLAELRRTLEDLQLSTRRIVADLRATPSTTDLEADLREFARRVDPPGTAVTVALRGDRSAIPPHVGDELFLVLREALRNVFAHAAARTVRVVIDVRSDRVAARVEDDGVGLGAAARPGGAGLASMRERVVALGGRFAVGPRRPRGTVVEVDIGTVGVADERVARAG